MSHPAVSKPHTKWGRSIGTALGAAVVVALILLAFVWPSVTSTLKDIPLAITGPADQVQLVGKALDHNAPGAFTLTTVESKDAALDRIKTRDAYGAIVLGPAPEVLTASANGAVVSQLLGQVAASVQAQANQAAAAGVAQAVAAGKAPAGTVAPTIVVKTSDVVPLASSDPRGTGLVAAAFPLVMGGMIGGIAVSLLVTGVWRRLVTVVVYSAVAGVGVAAIMQGWFGILQGNFAANCAAAALALLSTGALIVGANALLGTIGIPVGAVITMFIGNPMSSAAQPVQFMPGAWGAIGQFFVPGASATLLRDLSYFPDANAAAAWLVLGAWAVVGMVLMFVGHFRNQEVVHLDHALVEAREPATDQGAEPRLAEAAKHAVNIA